MRMHAHEIGQNVVLDFKKRVFICVFGGKLDIGRHTFLFFHDRDLPAIAASSARLCAPLRT